MPTQSISTGIPFTQTQFVTPMPSLTSNPEPVETEPTPAPVISNLIQEAEDELEDLDDKIRGLKEKIKTAQNIGLIAIATNKFEEAKMATALKLTLENELQDLIESRNKVNNRLKKLRGY